MHTELRIVIVTGKGQANANQEKREKAGQTCFVLTAEGFTGWPGRTAVAQKSRVNHKLRGTCPGLEQKRPSPQAKGVGKRGSSWVWRVAGQGARPTPHTWRACRGGAPVCGQSLVRELSCGDVLATRLCTRGSSKAGFSKWAE